MEKKLRFKSKARKPVYKKKKSLKVSNSSSVGKELTLLQKSPLPVKFYGKFRYAETFTFTTGTGGVMGTHQVMRLNNLWDPNYTGTGHQPYGFDQTYLLYSKYQVKRVKVTLIWSTTGGSAEVMGAYKVQCNANGGNLTGISCDYATEQPQTATCLISASGNCRVVEQNFIVDLQKVFGVSKKEFDDDGYISQSYSAAEPVKTALLTISAGSPSGVSGQTVTCQCILDYNAVFFERIDLAQST